MFDSRAVLCLALLSDSIYNFPIKLSVNFDKRDSKAVFASRASFVRL